MPQAKIKTNFGEIVFEFTNEEDLKKQLDGLDIKKIIDVIHSKIPQKESIGVIEEFKDLYTIDQNGIRLLKIPKEKNDQVRLTLFLAGRPMTTAEIQYATGISNPRSCIKPKGFEKKGDSVTIDSDTRKYVLEKIIPILRKDE